MPPRRNREIPVVPVPPAFQSNSNWPPLVQRLKQNGVEPIRVAAVPLRSVLHPLVRPIRVGPPLPVAKVGVPPQIARPTRAAPATATIGFFFFSLLGRARVNMKRLPLHVNRERTVMITACLLHHLGQAALGDITPGSREIVVDRH